ncbi:hypothetical protein HS1genome_0096 [Sulfodiicoccus acidiphilus]|uniref:Metalloprotease TldD/E C-terminal domain-containing protein n=1 Tax=Sulfodiicoccus acidiphilus TaxID=1670455 RepID=A0A348B0K5_9CREN|nr:metallopeptidase TldD-related protein [Sulfodiicoccus acidiphilus]BBD71707.1 hypothetical protein HS1genome_0096 [Sulfodiicoccus acidiphilus]GGT86459.1 hypothetical protein GCM10007116_00500 [Sulfodiicoccus acidiphilus]
MGYFEYSIYATLEGYRLIDLDLLLTKIKESGGECVIYAEEVEKYSLVWRGQLIPSYQTNTEYFVKVVKWGGSVELTFNEGVNVHNILDEIEKRYSPDPYAEVVKPDPLDKIDLRDPKLDDVVKAGTELGIEMGLTDPTGNMTGEVEVGRKRRVVKSTNDKEVSEVITVVKLRKWGWNNYGGVEEASSTRLDDPSLGRVIDFTPYRGGGSERVSGERLVEFGPKAASQIVKRIILPLTYPELWDSNSHIVLNQSMELYDQPRDPFSPHSRSFDDEGLRTSTSLLTKDGELRPVTNARWSKRLGLLNTKSATWIDSRLTARPTNVEIRGDKAEMEGDIFVEEVEDITDYTLSDIVLISVVRAYLKSEGKTLKPTIIRLSLKDFLQNMKLGTKAPQRYGNIKTPSLISRATLL